MLLIFTAIFWTLCLPMVLPFLCLYYLTRCYQIISQFYFLPELTSVSVEAQTQSRYYSPHFKSDFNELFNVQSAQFSLDSSFPDLDVNQHIELLNAAWLDILNVTAPFKLFKPKPKSDYWHTSNTRLLRQACRKAKMAKGQIPVII